MSYQEEYDARLSVDERRSRRDLASDAGGQIESISTALLALVPDLDCEQGPVVYALAERCHQLSHVVIGACGDPRETLDALRETIGGLAS